ncbi:MAG TPA: hypothetical protein VFK88_05555 [Gallionella sp.]|nr:hypothetical protein [Gallionella sp.]
MNIRFRPLFTFGVAHGYYATANPPSPDFDFVLAEHSQRALAGARLLARMHAGRLHVLFEAADDDSPLQDISGLELVIGLRLRNPYFEHFTAAMPEPLPLYTNVAATHHLDAARASDLAGDRFTPVAAITARPLALDIHRMGDNKLVWSGKIRDGENMPTLDLRSWSAGCYLVTQHAGAENSSRPLIVTPDLADAGMWGIVRIVVTPDFWSSSPPPDFEVRFDAREETLNYYVVAPPDWSDFDKLAVTDTAASSALTFEKLEPDHFPLDRFSDAQLGIPDVHAVLFRSTSMVPRQAAATKRLQLSRNGNPLIKNLPLPGADMPLARFIVQLSKT